MSKHPARLIVYTILSIIALAYTTGPLAATASPKVIQLVEVSALEKGTLTLSWLPASDDHTAHENLVYRVYLSKKADFLPGKATLKREQTGAVSATITGLKPATTYFAVVTATDTDGNTSWSNLLAGKTTASNPKRTAVQVHELSAKQLTQSAQQFKTGDYIVSRENGGSLRKIDAAARISQTTPANHGSLNELFSELAFSSTIKLQDLPAQTAATQKLSIKAPSPTQTAMVTWTDTGLTLSDSEPAQNTSAITAKSLAIDGGLQTETGKYTRMNAPVSVGVVPGIADQWKANIYVPQTKSPNQELCKAKLVSFTHPDAGKNSLPKPSFSFERTQDSAGDYRQGRLLVDWMPTDNHVDLKGRPYTATIRAYIDDKGENCNGFDDSWPYLGWAEALTMTVPVYVTKGQPNDTAKDELISFQGGFNVTDTVSYDIRPEIFIGATISGGALQTADLNATADLSISNKLTITATGAATLTPQRKTLAQKSFIKLFVTPSGIPIVVSGKFKVDAELTGHVNGKASLEKLLTLKFPATQFGLEYRKANTPRWQVVKNVTPGYSFQIKGEADASADVTLTLIPDLQISFYDAATGRLIVEPYLYAQAGLHGQFDYLNDNGGKPLTDLDYWFTDLQAGAGANLKLFAGLSIFDYQIASYPSGTTIDQIDSFKQVTLMAKTPLAKLPTLTAAVNAAPPLADTSDTRQMYIQGQAKDYTAPYNIGLIKFANWTQPNLLTTATGAALKPATKAGGYWFKYRNKGTYKVRLAATTNLGVYVRQIAETTITLTDDDNDGMVDQWETRFGITDPNADDDQDGTSNLAEFNKGTQPNNANSYSFTLTASAGDKQATLNWNAVNGASNYGVCRATVSITDINNCLNYAGGVWQDTPGTTLQIGALTNGNKYWFRALAEDTSKTLRVSNQVAVIPNKPYGINDTGITTCSDGGNNGLACPVAGYPNQDAQSGRDVSQNDNSNGHAGFNFTKISGAGAALPANATSWNCVKDNVTGLMWEVKTDNGGLHDKDWYYTWYEPDNSKNGGFAGYQNGGFCSGSQCDTHGYVQAVNAAGWCGYKDWRMPTVDELSGIASLDRYNPSIDSQYFPNTQNAWFWSSSPVADFRYSAWIVSFYNGYDHWSNKSNDSYVRLVRSGQ